jgi:hypothetical protein
MSASNYFEVRTAVLSRQQHNFFASLFTGFVILERISSTRRCCLTCPLSELPFDNSYKPV